MFVFSYAICDWMYVFMIPYYIMKNVTIVQDLRRPP